MPIGLAHAGAEPRYTAQLSSSHGTNPYAFELTWSVRAAERSPLANSSKSTRRCSFNVAATTLANGHCDHPSFHGHRPTWRGRENEPAKHQPRHSVKISASGPGIPRVPNGPAKTHVHHFAVGLNPSERWLGSGPSRNGNLSDRADQRATDEALATTAGNWCRTGSLLS